MGILYYFFKDIYFCLFGRIFQSYSQFFLKKTVDDGVTSGWEKLQKNNLKASLMASEIFNV